MKWLATLLLATMLCGCSPDYPFKWKPTEAQKQAADITVKDVMALEPYVAPEAQPIRQEALMAAEVTQTYMGLPNVRPTPMAAINPATLAGAAGDAAKPPPTFGEVGNAVVDEIGKKSDAVFGLADSILALVATIAGTYGATKLGGKVNGWRQDKNTLQDKANVQFQALREIIAGIDQLTPELKTQVKDIMGKVQTGGTTQIVARVKTGDVS